MRQNYDQHFPLNSESSLQIVGHVRGASNRMHEALQLTPTETADAMNVYRIVFEFRETNESILILRTHHSAASIVVLCVVGAGL